MEFAVNYKRLPEEYKQRILEAARLAAQEAAQETLKWIKSPSVWGTRTGLKQDKRSFWGTSASRPGFHSGQLYGAVNIVGPYVSNDSVYVGIGDIALLDSLRPPSFFIPGTNRTIKRNNSQKHGYWWYLEYGVHPNQNSRFVPVGLSPWSRRGVGKTKGNALINGWGQSRRKTKTMLVPIARSPTFNLKKNLFPKRPAGAGPRFYRNAAVGFMVRSKGNGHPGVKPTYMFLRAQRHLEKRFRVLFRNRFEKIRQQYLKKLVGK